MTKDFTPNHLRQMDNSASQQQYNDPTLDVDWLCSFTQCAHYTDKRATQIIATLSAFSLILVEFVFSAQQTESVQDDDKAVKSITSTQIIPLKPKKKVA